MSGAFICRTSDQSVTADKVFLLLESVYGPPNLDTKGYVVVDRKSSWEWVFKTPNGYLACYDYKGAWSIGYRNKLNDKLKEDAQHLAEVISAHVKNVKRRKKRLPKFSNFMHSFGATRLLLQRAHDQGFLIEGLMLYASLIDGLLRLALILKEQIDSKSHVINEALISQNKEGPKYSERNIFEMAHNNNIIKKRLFNKINNLYDQRNKIVHRFFLSNAEYADLSKVLIEYGKIFQQINKIIAKLEHIQLKKGVGISRKMPIQRFDKNQFNRDVHKKIDSKNPPIIKPQRNYLFDDI